MEELIFTSVKSMSIYLLVLICLRLLGKKGVAELSITDLVLVVLIGSHIAPQLPENNKWGGAIVSIVTLTLLCWLINWLTFRFKKIRRVVEGTPLILIQNGKIIHKNLKKEMISMDTLKESIRNHGLENMEKVKLAILETDGEISIIEAN